MTSRDTPSSGIDQNEEETDAVLFQDPASDDIVHLLERVRDLSPRCLDDLVDEASGGDRLSHDSISFEDLSEFPTRIGRFRILDKLGEGGFGMVFLAHDPELDREVALKIPRPDTLLSQDARARFVNEGKAIAKLNHPHVAPVLEAGSIGPICYLVTTYCRGGSLAQVLADLSKTNKVPVLNFNESAALLCGIAEAAHHAHERGVVHRDLKPANIVFEIDGDSPLSTQEGLAAHARLVDFGLAKSVDTDSQHTKTGASLGTPDYTSPEQSTNTQVGPAADIFSLGAILYELITSEPPFRCASAIETLIAVRNDAPVPPRRLVRNCPKDLEAVCLRCLEKDPAHRYASADHLVKDLKRFLRGESVLARRPPIGIRLGRWCKRYPLAAALTGLIIALAIAGPLVAWRQNILLREAQQARLEASRSLYLSDMNLAFQDWDAANLERCGTLLQQHIPAEAQPDNRAFEWYYLHRKWQSANDVPVIVRLPNIESMALSHDGKLLALGSHNGTVLLWDREKKRALAVWKAHAYEVSHLDFSSDDQVLASARIDGSIKTWDVATQEELATFVGGRCVVCSPSDGTIVFAGSGGDFFILADGGTIPQQVNHAHDGIVTALAISPDGSSVATIGLDARLRVWDLMTQKCLHEATADHSLWCVNWSPDGKHIGTGDTYGNVRIWGSECQPIQNIAAHQANVRTLVFSTDTHTLATSAEDNTIRLWDVETGQEKKTLLAHRAHVVDLAFTDDNQTLLSASIDGDVRAWQLSPETRAANELFHPAGANGVAFSPDGRLLATTCNDGHVRIWDATSGKQLSELPAHDGVTWRCVFLRFQKRLALASTGSDGRVRIWDVESSEQLLEIPCRPNFDPMPVAVHPDEQKIAFTDSDASACIWDLQENRQLARHQHGAVGAIQFSPDGSTLALTTEGNNIRLFNVETSEQIAHQQAHTRAIMRLAFSPDSNHLASASHDRSILTWVVSPTDGLTQQHHLTGPGGIVDALVYSPDGKILASAGGDKVIRIWDAETGRQRAVLKGHHSEIYDLAFSPDGQILASAGSDHVVRIWRATP